MTGHSWEAPSWADGGLGSRFRDPLERLLMIVRVSFYSLPVRMGPSGHIQVRVSAQFQHGLSYSPASHRRLKSPGMLTSTYRGINNKVL